MTNSTTIALWGTGDITPENADALLGEYVPDADLLGAIYAPERTPRDQKGLRTALAWFEKPEYNGGAEPSTDLVQSLTFDRDTHGDDVYLLALWPEVPTHEDFDYIEMAQNSGITVLDLARGMDELDLSLYSRPEKTKEEKAAERAAAKAERDAAKPASRSKKRLSDEAAAVVEGGDDPCPVIGVTHPSTPIVEDTTPVDGDELEAAGVALMRSIDHYIEVQVRHTLGQHGITINAYAADAVGPLLDSEQNMTRPPFEGPFVDETTDYYVTGSMPHEYRLATGKKRRGETLVHLTAEDEKGLGLK